MNSPEKMKWLLKRLADWKAQQPKEGKVIKKEFYGTELDKYLDEE